MNINDAFSTEAIERHPLTEEERADLVETIGDLMETGTNYNELAAFCFRAGRAYQSDQPFEVTIPRELFEAWQVFLWNVGQS